jgi:hypothetical protein
VSAPVQVPIVPVENSPTPPAGGVNPDSGMQRRAEICSGGRRGEINQLKWDGLGYWRRSCVRTTRTRWCGCDCQKNAVMTGVASRTKMKMKDSRRGIIEDYIGSVPKSPSTGLKSSTVLVCGTFSGRNDVGVGQSASLRNLYRIFRWEISETDMELALTIGIADTSAVNQTRTPRPRL